jgi:hypothetical protein
MSSIKKNSELIQNPNIIKNVEKIPKKVLNGKKNMLFFLYRVKCSDFTFLSRNSLSEYCAYPARGPVADIKTP